MTSPDVVCTFCGRAGHRASHCPARPAGALDGVDAGGALGGLDEPTTGLVQGHPPPQDRDGITRG